MHRYRITIEYDGSGFVGWQWQKNGLSVQAVLESAASKIIGARAAIAVHGAGRTDAGVHALGQVAHFDLPYEFDPHRLPLALNAYLPDTVRVISAQSTAADFHSRFDAIKRLYRYRLSMRRIAPVLERGQVWHIGQPLDTGAMAAAAQYLLGKHDFTSFRATHCQAKSPWRTLDVLAIETRGDTVDITAEARSFLHHQVRIIVGTLVLVGDGRWSPDRVGDALTACHRTAAGPTAPAQGLCLMRIDYP